MTILCATVTPNAVSAAEIYSSTDSTGQTRWSTQALDTSYVHVLSANSIAGLNATNGAQFPRFLYAAKVNSAKLETRRQALSSLIDDTTRRHNVDTGLVVAIIEVESSFNIQAISSKGARGLMQLMPGTAQRYGMKNIQELYDPARNLDMGVRHLKHLLNQHAGQWPLAIAAYNAGQHAVAKHGQRIPRYHETMLYVPAVLSIAARYASDNTDATTPLENLKWSR